MLGSPIRNASRMVAVVLAATALLLMATPSEAWTGTVAGGGTTYNGKDDNAGVVAPYTLVYGSGDWTARPVGAWSAPPAGIDISTTGTSVAIPDSYGGGNKWSAGINLGFTFNYFGSPFTTVRAYGYGGISPGTAANNPVNFVYPMTSTSGSAVNWLIAPVWDTSMNAGCTGAQAPGASTKYQIFGNAPYRVFVFQFTNIHMYNGGACNQIYSAATVYNTYQIRLYETTDVIEFHYNHIDNLDPYGGSERYAGIRGSGAAQGLNYYTCANGNCVVNTRVVQFRPTFAVPAAADDSFTWDYGFGSNTQLSVSGFPTATTGTLLSNDRSVGSASLQAEYVAGSLSAGASLQPGTSCTGTAPSLAGDGGFCLSTPGNQNPCDQSWSFQYRVNDGWGVASAPATVTIDVVNCDMEPISGNDPHQVDPGTPATQYQATEDLLRTVSAHTPQSNPASCGLASGVLCNDWDADNIPSPGPPSTLSVHNPGLRATLQGGTADVTAQGGFTYAPLPQYCGTDSFEYQATDSILPSAVATAYVSVACVSDAPNANQDTFVLLEDCSAASTNPATACTHWVADACPAPAFTARGVLCNDTDADTHDDAGGGPNSGFTAGIGDLAGPRNEAVRCNGPGQAPMHLVVLDPDGSFTYSAPANFHGTDTFWYRVHDPMHQGGHDTPCVRVTINVLPVSDDPQAFDDDYPSVPNVGTYVVPVASGVLQNDVNPDYPSANPPYGGLSVISWSPVACNPSATGMALGGTSPTGGFSFSPPTSPGYVGVCQFAYTISNGAHTASATVRLHVVELTAPFAIDDSCSLMEDPNPNPWPCAGNVFANDHVFGGSAPAPVAILDSPATVPGVGTLTLQANGDYSFAPAWNWNGAVSYRYRFTQDPGNGSPQTSNAAFIAINVGSVNDAPVGLDLYWPCFPEDTEALAAAGSLLADVRDSHGGAPGEDNLWPDSPPRLRVVVPNLPITTAKGQVTEMADDGSFRFVPTPDMAGLDSFTYRVQDAGGTADGGQDTSAPITVTLCITPTSDPPVANDDPAVAAYDVPNIVTLPISIPELLANDFDSDTPYTGDSIEFHDYMFTAVPGSGNTLLPPAGGLLVFRPGAGYVGMQEFQYRVRDATGLASNWATVTIRVFEDKAPNAAFVPSSQTTFVGYPLAFTDSSTDPDDGHVGCWRWDFGDGRISEERNPVHTYLAAGTYVVRLTVCDLYGLTASTTHVVHAATASFVTPGGAESPVGLVGGVAALPLAWAGDDQVAFENQKVVLNGSAQPVGVQAFQWRQVGPGAPVELTGADTANPSFWAPTLDSPSPQRLTFELVVRDGQSASLPDFVEVEVRPLNRAPQPHVTAMLRAWPGETVQLDASRSTDADGDGLTFAWVQRDAGPIVDLRGAATATPTFLVPADTWGTQFQFQVVISDGQVTVSDSVVVVVGLPFDEPAPQESETPVTQETNLGEIVVEPAVGLPVPFLILGVFALLLLVGTALWHTRRSRRGKRR